MEQQGIFDRLKLHSDIQSDMTSDSAVIALTL